MWKVYLEFEEEEIVYEDENEITQEVVQGSFKQFTPRHIYRNPVPDVLTKEINIDFDPNQPGIINIYCVIISYVKNATETTESEALWYIPYISRTRREALQIKKKIDLDELDIIDNEIPQWKQKGYEYVDSDIFIVPIED